LIAFEKPFTTLKAPVTTSISFLSSEYPYFAETVYNSDSHKP
jgi:hypothetical protein